ncbi:hypothetical protein ACWD5Q_30860 [Streptomyces sp. NPDC002513]
MTRRGTLGVAVSGTGRTGADHVRRLSKVVRAQREGRRTEVEPVERPALHR